jgi:hypothetical protein
MRAFYLDPALRHDVEHQANYCRYSVGELRARARRLIPLRIDEP